MSDDELLATLRNALYVEVNGGELESITDVYTPVGAAIVLRHRLAAAGLLVAPPPRRGGE